MGEGERRGKNSWRRRLLLLRALSTGERQLAKASVNDGDGSEIRAVEWTTKKNQLLRFFGALATES